jgi:hypothetical protein
MLLGEVLAMPKVRLEQIAVTRVLRRLQDVLGGAVA